jgi:hypothetical protein
MCLVYVIKKGPGGDRGTTQTYIKKVEGDVFRLRKDLDDFLFQRFDFTSFLEQRLTTRSNVYIHGTRP